MHRQGHFQQCPARRLGDVRRREKVRPLRKVRIIRSAVSTRCAATTAPIYTGSYRTVDPVSRVKQHGGITAVKPPPSGTMTDDPLIEPVLKEAGHRLDLRLHYRRGILDKIRLIVEIVVCQRVQRWRVPRVEVHTDFAGVA